MRGAVTPLPRRSRGRGLPPSGGRCFDLDGGRVAGFLLRAGARRLARLHLLRQTPHGLHPLLGRGTHVVAAASEVA